MDLQVVILVSLVRWTRLAQQVVAHNRQALMRRMRIFLNTELILTWMLGMFLFPIPVLADAPSTSVRIRTGAEGLYWLGYEELRGAGAPVDAIDPARLSMNYLGESIDILVEDGGDGRLDPGDGIIFYAEPYHGRYMVENVYWLSWNGDSERMARRAYQPKGIETSIDVITHTLHIEYDRDYRSKYDRARDQDHWFDMPLSVVTSSPVVTRTYAFTPTHLIGAGEVVVRGMFHGGRDQDASPDQSVRLRLNGGDLGLFQWDGSTDFLASAITQTTVLTDGVNLLTMTADLADFPPEAGINSYWISPDWVEIEYPARAVAEEGHLLARGVPAGPVELVAREFSTPDVLVVGVTDPRHPVRITSVNTRPDADGYTIHMWDNAPENARYAFSTPAGLLRPTAIELDQPSNLRSPRPDVDYIAIVHRSLWDAIDPLLEHRRAEGLSVAKVDVQDIYDEFNFGRLDPEAIRAFLTYAYHHWGGDGLHPQFVLLVGDGHYDFRGVSGTTQPNLIPPYLIDIDPWFGETAADNRYVSIDGPDDYLPEMSIGRIPARTPADVTAVVDKILAYEAAPAGDWQKRIVFAADRTTGFDANFQAISDDIRRNWLPPAYDDRQLYYLVDYHSGEEMRAAFKRAFNETALILQWFGHASRFRWGSVSMFNIFDPPTLEENTVWPVTFTYACWSGYFINIYRDWQTLGETLLLTPRKGSVADVSPAGLHVGSSLAVLNQGIIKAIYQDKVERLGPAIDAGKRYVDAHSDAWPDIIDTSILFGDPALRLRRPERWDLDRSGLLVETQSPMAGHAVTATLTIINDATHSLDDVRAVVNYDTEVLAIEDAPPGVVIVPGQVTWELSLTPGEQRALPLVFRVQPHLAEDRATTLRATISASGQDDVIIEQTLRPWRAPWQIFHPLTFQMHASP